MVNLTITVDGETLKRARIKAIERDESVNRVLADRLREYAGTSDDSRRARNRATVEALLTHARSVSKTSPEGWSFARDDAYDERTGR